MAMTQPVLCHRSLLEPGSVGASTLRLPSLILLSGAVDEQMFVVTLRRCWNPGRFSFLFCKPSTE